MNSIDTRLLAVFNEIYKSRSVTAAAEALDMGQPAVSVALSKLRHQFGDPLFRQSRVGVAFGQQPNNQFMVFRCDALDLLDVDGCLFADIAQLYGLLCFGLRLRYGRRRCNPGFHHQQKRKKGHKAARGTWFKRGKMGTAHG